ncbi:hypothetical protein ACFX13_025522 [Malus domestica]|uniref:Uncharacterized protein n=1 Tax=Malus domestica TaxID=3750 RepID=A0A498H903_MALDO|nr:hypothetical protein DVH24_027410 [Malus domestica]
MASIFKLRHQWLNWSDSVINSSMGPFELRDGVEFGDLEGEEAKGWDEGVEVEVEDAAGEGDVVDDDEEEGVEDATAAFSTMLRRERRGRFPLVVVRLWVGLVDWLWSTGLIGFGALV